MPLLIKSSERLSFHDGPESAIDSAVQHHIQIKCLGKIFFCQNIFAVAGRHDFTISDELEVKLLKGHKYLFNIGSIGQPRNGDNRASFAVFDSDKQCVTRYRVPYNIAAAQEKVRAAGLPERLAARLEWGR